MKWKMKAGFGTSSMAPDKHDTCIGCYNFVVFNDVDNIPFSDNIRSKFDTKPVGVWKPKGSPSLL